MDKNRNEYLRLQQDYLERSEQGYNQKYPIIVQNKQFSPSVQYSEGKFLLSVPLTVNGEHVVIHFDLSADQVANLNSQCAKSLAPYVYYDLRREIGK